MQQLEYLFPYLSTLRVISPFHKLHLCEIILPHIFLLIKLYQQVAMSKHTAHPLQLVIQSVTSQRCVEISSVHWFLLNCNLVWKNVISCFKEHGNHFKAMVIEIGRESWLELPCINYHFSPVLTLIDLHKIKCANVFLSLYELKVTFNKDLLL